MKKSQNPIFFSLKYVFHYLPGYFLVSLLYHVGTECGSAVHNVWVYNLVISILESGEHPERLILVVGGLALYATVTGMFFGWYEEKFRPMQEEKLSFLVKQQVLDRTAQMKLQEYDAPGFYNDVVMNLDEAHGKLAQILHLCMQIVGAAVAIVLTVAAYARIGMTYLSLFVVVVFLALFLSRTVAARKVRRKEEMIPWERKKSYFSSLLTQRFSAQDIRIYGVDRLFVKHYEEAITEIKNVVRREGRVLAVLDFIQNFVIERLLLNCAILVYLAYSVVVTRTIGLTGFVTAFKGVSVIADAINQIFGRYIISLHEYGLFVSRLQRFLEQSGTEAEEEGKRPPVRRNQSIEIKDVSFHYPASDTNVINHMNLSVLSGKRIAIVGRNGAGKSTLVKLLLGLYTPQSGEILLDGVPMKNYAMEKFGQNCGILFQQFNLYAFAIANNISMDLTYESAAAQEALSDCGFLKMGVEMKEGLSTEITKEFYENGLQLSGGQQQILASARLYYKEADRCMFVMDEPSSALDPRLESEMNENVWKLTEGVTTVIISHRLSMTRNADLIYYIEDGRVLESGSHEELCALGGKYADMWNIQAQNYRAGAE